MIIFIIHEIRLRGDKGLLGWIYWMQRTESTHASQNKRDNYGKVTMQLVEIKYNPFSGKLDLGNLNSSGSKQILPLILFLWDLQGVSSIYTCVPFSFLQFAQEASVLPGIFGVWRCPQLSITFGF